MPRFYPPISISFAPISHFLSPKKEVDVFKALKKRKVPSSLLPLKRQDFSQTPRRIYFRPVFPCAKFKMCVCSWFYNVHALYCLKPPFVVEILDIWVFVWRSPKYKTILCTSSSLKPLRRLLCVVIQARRQSVGSNICYHLQESTNGIFSLRFLERGPPGGEKKEEEPIICFNLLSPYKRIKGTHVISVGDSWWKRPKVAEKEGLKTWEKGTLWCGWFSSSRVQSSSSLPMVHWNHYVLKTARKCFHWIRKHHMLR